MKKSNSLSEIKYDASGLVPAIVQDAKTNEVLMMAYMNAELLGLTLSNWRNAFLVTQPSGVVAQGRDFWKYSTRGRGPRGL